MKKTVILALAVLLTGALGMPAFAQAGLSSVNYLTEEYPPFNFQKDGKLSGISIDLIAEVFKATKATKTVADIQLQPWARSYAMVQSEPNTALFAMTRTAERENLFKWAGPIAPTRIVVLAKKGSGVKVASAADLQKYGIGVVRDDIGQLLMVTAGYAESKLQKADSSTALLKLLDSGRLDAIAYEENVARYVYKGLGLSSGLDTVWVLQSSNVYYAFSKQTPDSVIQAFQQAIDALKASGTIQAIIAKYQ